MGFKRINYYIDSRANKTYYIYRLADTSFLKDWKKIVEDTLNQERNYIAILTGIFAGEGNVKYDAKSSSRNIRISGKKKEGKEIIEKILTFLDLPIKYNEEHGDYWISGRQLDRIKDLDLCILHSEKSHKFLKMMLSKKEKHYSPGEIKSLLLQELNNPQTTKNLSKTLDRGEIRILEVLQELRREQKVGYIKMQGTFYWMQIELKEDYLIRRKIAILKALSTNNSYTDMGKATGIFRKTIKKELEKLKTEGYLCLDSEKYEMTEKGKILLLGADEAGRLVGFSN